MKKFNALNSSAVKSALAALSLFALPGLTLAEGAAPQSAAAVPESTAAPAAATTTAAAPAAVTPPAAATTAAPVAAAAATPPASDAATPPAAVPAASAMPANAAANDASSAPATATAPAPDAAASAPTSKETATAAPADGTAAAPVALAPPPEDKGQVVFFRPSRFTGSALSFSVHKEKLGIGKLGNGTYFVYIAEPGLNEFTIQSEVTDKLRLEVDAGDTYYVEQKIAMGIMMGRPVLSPSTKEDFEKKPLKLSTKKATDLK